MIPCYICGQDASTGWTKGFVPAPDSQKLALCAAHNTPANRLAVVKAWNALISGDIRSVMDVAKYKASPALHMASVHFAGGGLLSFTCTACTPTRQNTLRIDAPDGTQTFIPMQHIREYTVRPYGPDEKKAAPEAEKKLTGAASGPDQKAAALNREKGSPAIEQEEGAVTKPLPLEG